MYAVQLWLALNLCRLIDDPSRAEDKSSREPPASVIEDVQIPVVAPTPEVVGSKAGCPAFKAACQLHVLPARGRLGELHEDARYPHVDCGDYGQVVRRTQGAYWECVRFSAYTNGYRSMCFPLKPMRHTPSAEGVAGQADGFADPDEGFPPRACREPDRDEDGSQQW